METLYCQHIQPKIQYKSKLFFSTSVGLESQLQSPSACALYWALDLAFHVVLGLVSHMVLGQVSHVVLGLVSHVVLGLGLAHQHHRH
jgi:hypothetical protein